MSDAPTSSPTIGDVVDATTDQAASEAAAQVASAIPEPTATTVVVESDPNDTTGQGLDAAAHMRQIAREEADKYMTELVAYDAAAKATQKPEVVVIQQEAAPPPTPTPPVETAPPEDKPDDAPPMARSHPYFKPIGLKRKDKQ